MSNSVEQEEIQRELKSPLLEKTADVEIHSAIPLANGDASESAIVDGRCNIVNGIYVAGFFVGLLVQSCSLYAFGVVMPAPQNGEEQKIHGNHSVPTLFALYFFSRYWVLIGLLLPPVITTMIQKYRQHQLLNKKTKKSHEVMVGKLEGFFQCIRFQLGMFFGSLILLSAVNFYALAKTAPIYMLLGYYGICVVVSLIALCLLQIFVNQVCMNITSVEIIVSYDNDEESATE